MKNYLAKYKREHINLSGAEVRILDSFVKDLENEYLVALLKLEVCECGRKFLPNAKNNKWCEQHSSNNSYQRKIKSMDKQKITLCCSGQSLGEDLHTVNCTFKNLV